MEKPATSENKLQWNLAGGGIVTMQSYKIYYMFNTGSKALIYSIMNMWHGTWNLYEPKWLFALTL